MAGCEFNKSGTDQRSNFGEQLPAIVETKEMSDEVDAISVKEEDFKDLISFPELKVGTLKRWANNTSQLLTDFLAVRGERLSASAKEEIQNTIAQLNQVLAELEKRDELENIPYELQAGIRSLIAENGKTDFNKIGLFVQTLAQLDSLKGKADIYFSGQQDVKIEEIESWMMESKIVIQTVNEKFSNQLIPPLKREIEEQQKMLELLAGGVAEMKSKGTTVITGKEIQTIKKVVDAKADLKAFLESLKQVELTKENFKAIFIDEFSLQALIDWAQKSLGTLIDFQSSWSFLLEKEENIQLRMQISQLENIIPILLFAQEKEIAVDRALISSIREEVKKDAEVNWQEIGRLATQTYGEIGDSGSIRFETLPIEHGYYIVEDEKILVTAELVRHIPHFERVKKFEEKLQAKTGFVMMEMLTKGEEIQNMGPIKKAMAYKGYKSVMRSTKESIQEMPNKERKELLIEFSQYQSDLDAIGQVGEIKKNERLAEGIQGSRCLSYYLLEQDDKMEAEGCPAF